MIKWLLLSALGANLLAFFWFFGQEEGLQDREGYARRWQEAQAGEILLLSELEAIPPARSRGAIGETLVKEPVSEVRDAALASVLSPLAHRVDHGIQTVPVDVNPGDTVSHPVGGVKKRQDDSRDKQAVQQQAPVPERLPEPGSNLLCVNLGRFDKEEDATELVEKLQAAVGVAANLKPVTEGLVRYLVYMPPFENLAMAKQQQVKLKDSGVSSSLYYKGELENGLSLGYFGSYKNAERKHAELLAAGHKVLLRTLENKVVRYSIEMRRRENSKLSRYFWQDLAEQFPNVVRKEVLCSVGEKEPVLE